MNYDRLTPVEQALQRKKRILHWIIILFVLIGFYYFVFVRTYVIKYDDEVAHFKYGSIGSEVENGLPYWIFKAIPHLFQDKLGGQGYKSFGFLYEKPDSDLPIGFSRRVVTGVDRVWLNCAVCHTGTYNDPDGNQQILVGAPANQLKLLDFIQLLRSAPLDDRFNADNILNSIEAVGGDLNFIEKLIYRYIVIERVRSGLLSLQEQLSFLDRKDLNDWGAGRVDTFTPYKAMQFNFPLDEENLSSVLLNGAADYPSIWMQRPRQGMNLHWDGNNSSVEERNLSAALGAGVTPVTVDINSLKRIESWLKDFPSPKFPGPINKVLAMKGSSLYKKYCSECHGNGTYLASESSPGFRYDYSSTRYKRLGQVENINDIGTDTGRLKSYTQAFSGAQNMLYAGYPWRFAHFKKTNGYANHPLDGIWARSPYLHNGSVPTLRHLLEPSNQRPKKFFRGSKNYDWKKVGYQSYPDNQSLEESNLFEYDTTKLGNSNVGHEGVMYGTHLSADEKDAIVEFMKMF